MADVLIIKNITREGPGLLADVLADHRISYTVVDVDKGESIPSPIGYKALVVLGGPASANDSSDTMRAELQQVRVALDNGIPYLGICLGLQVGVKAAGGRVVPGTDKEVGFMNPAGEPYVIEVTDVGRADPLLAGLPDPLRVFQLHGEVVTLADGMQLLGTSSGAPNQIVKIADKAYGIQSHFELTDGMLQTWAAEDPDLTPLGYPALKTHFDAIHDTYASIGEMLMHNFLRIAGLL